MIRILASLLVLALLWPAAAAEAQPLSRIVADKGLSPEDFRLMSAAGRAAAETGAPGRARSWSNPASGSNGSVTLEAMRDGCAVLRHRTFPKGGDQPFELRGKFCPDSAGNWVLTP